MTHDLISPQLMDWRTKSIGQPAIGESIQKRLVKKKVLYLFRVNEVDIECKYTVSQRGE